MLHDLHHDVGAHPLPSKLERVTRLPTFQAARIFTVNHTAMDVFWEKA
jgi:hypothetical protein